LEALLAAVKANKIFELVKRTGISAEKLQLFFDKFAQLKKYDAIFNGCESIFSRGE
jgi:assimilatory nitrate reductase catalytic subunit